MEAEERRWRGESSLKTDREVIPWDSWKPRPVAQGAPERGKPWKSFCSARSITAGRSDEVAANRGPPRTWYRELQALHVEVGISAPVRWMCVLTRDVLRICVQAARRTIEPAPRKSGKALVAPLFARNSDSNRLSARAQFERNVRAAAMSLGLLRPALPIDRRVPGVPGV